ncbi:MAG: hypothetical protein HYW24_00890 [Candidatus Aenigmarchaeota archaeon]|nr:hypothetical protein [Candidatus Aenigmarchaeota archaeon]
MDQKYPYPIITEKIYGKDLTILGVEHKHDFFNEYREFFENFVTRQDAIVLEQVLHRSLGVVNFWEGEGFYRDVGKIAGSQGKKVYQVDPGNWGVFVLDLETGVLGSCMAAVTTFNLLESYIRRENISRRKLLKRLLKLAVGVQLSWSGLPGIIIQDDLSGFFGGYGIDDLLGYGAVDYRNIVIAEDLERLLSYEVPSISRIGSIHGYLHSAPIQTYLKNRELRMKRLVYFPHDVIGDTKIREYTPRGDDWRLTRTF